MKGEFISLRSDIEVYIGFYLIVTWFLGWSNIISIIVYWQLLRIKYIINYNTKAAFTRIDEKISAFVNTPSCPRIVGMAYGKIKSFMSYMSSMEQG